MRFLSSCFVVFPLLFFFYSRKSHETPPPAVWSPRGWRPLGSGPPSAGEANFAGKQESHYGKEDGKDEEHVRGAHHRVVGQLVRLAPHLVDVEAYGEDERRHAEQDHWRKQEERENKR